MDAKEYRPVMKKKREFDDISKLMDQDCREDLVFRGVSNSEYDLIPSAYRPKTKLVLKKEAECYLSKQNMFRIDENANFEMVFHEVAVLRWFYEEVNKKGLPVPDTPHSDTGNEFLDVQGLSFNLDGKRFIDEWSEIAALAQHYGIPTRMLDWTTDLDMAVNFAVKDLPEEDSDEDHAKMVGLWILDRSKVALLGSEIKFVTTKYYGNENITEQQGLFTVIAGSDPG